MKLPDSNEKRKYGDRASHAIPVWNGLLEHCERIGSAIWEFLWCLDKITEEEDGIGKVLGGAPVKAERITGDLKRGKTVVSKNLQRLKQEGYLKLRRTPYGYVIEVTNSLKFGIWRPWREAQKQQLSEGESRKNAISLGGESRKNAIYKLRPSRKKDPAKRLQPSKGQKADPRFQPIMNHYWERTREVTGANPSWDGGDGAALKGLLKQHGETPASQITGWLDNAFCSTDSFPLRQGFRFTEFARHHLKYVAGPLHKGNSNQGAGNGQGGVEKTQWDIVPLEVPN